MLQERLCEVVEHVMFYQVFAFLIGVCFRDESCSLGRLTSLAPGKHPDMLEKSEKLSETESGT